MILILGCTTELFYREATSTSNLVEQKRMYSPRARLRRTPNVMAWLLDYTSRISRSFIPLVHHFGTLFNPISPYPC